MLKEQTYLFSEEEWGAAIIRLAERKITMNLAHLEPRAVGERPRDENGRCIRRAQDCPDFYCPFGRDTQTGEPLMAPLFDFFCFSAKEIVSECMQALKVLPDGAELGSLAIHFAEAASAGAQLYYRVDFTVTD